MAVRRRRDVVALEQRAPVEADRAVVIGDDAERSGFAQEQTHFLAPPPPRAHAARDDVRARPRLRALEDDAGVRVELVMLVSDELEVTVPADMLLRPAVHREEVAPRRADRVEVEARSRRAHRARIGAERSECLPDAADGRLGERPRAILRRDELGGATPVAGEKRNAVLEAFVDNVRRVVDQ